MTTRVRWLHVLLPELALDLLGRAGMNLAADQAVVVSSGDSGRREVHQASIGARQSGVRPGMAVATAQALRADLQLSIRNPVAEQQALVHLAGWAYGYSSRVAVQAPGLLLEMGGSRRISGADVLVRMTRQLAELGYHPVFGHGPTPAAARLAARTAASENRSSGLRSAAYERIRSLVSLRLTELDAAHVDLLDRCGVQTLAVLLQLPRDGLVRRIGRAGLKRLDQLTGQLAEPIIEYRPPLNFSSRVELPAPLSQTQALLFPLRRLLVELSAHLTGSDRALQHLDLVLQHETGVIPALHRFQIGLLTPSRNADHLLDLARYALEKQKLAGAVVALELHVPQLLPHQPTASDLFHAAGSTPDWIPLMERLRGRLGEAAVQQFQLQSAHRPEHGFSSQGTSTDADHKAHLHRLASHRPVWLLDPPLPVRVEDYQLCGTPERIETGWWDNQDATRDYYRAIDPQARQLWLFQDRRNPHRWFLHGIFG